MDGHAEVLLSTPTSRVRWAVSHALLALLGVAVILLIGGLTIGIGNALAMGDAGGIGGLLWAALARVPAAWVLTGVVLLVFGWLPRWVPAVWAVFVVALVIGEFGPLWDLPQWLMDVSPFVHSPRLPAVDSSNAGLVPLVVVTVALVTAGLLGWRRRDLQAH